MLRMLASVYAVMAIEMAPISATNSTILLANVRLVKRFVKAMARIFLRWSYCLWRLCGLCFAQSLA